MNILITGSSRGIGKAIAKRFDTDGNKIIINSRNEDDLIKILPEFKYSSKALAIAADISVYSEAERLFDIAEKQIGGIDVLVNNAGISYIGLFQDMTPYDWDKIIGVNINGVLNCSRLAVPYMISQKNGCIINISSIWGVCGASCEAVYSMTKGGINTFTKSLAKELAPIGVRVNAIACGVIDTDMNNFLSDEEKSEIIENIPYGRLGKADEVAGLAYFLAGKESSYLSGQVIVLDGGFI